VEDHASNHVEDVCIEEEQIPAYDTPLEIIDEDDDTSALDGCTYDEIFKSTKDEDAKSCPTCIDYEEMLQLADVEDRTSLLLYDTHDEGGSSMIAPYPIYDAYNDKGMTLPQHDDEMEQRPLALQGLEDQVLVTKEQIVQVLTREDGAHRFIEDLM
jgi:hypothetical protein